MSNIGIGIGFVQPVGETSARLHLSRSNLTNNLPVNVTFALYEATEPNFPEVVHTIENTNAANLTHTFTGLQHGALYTATAEWSRSIGNDIVQEAIDLGPVSFGEKEIS